MAEVILGADMPAELIADVSSALADMGISVRQPPQLPPPPIDTPRGKVIVVVSPKGGSGKTVLASNLAVVLANRFPGQVAAVDLDVQFGDLGSSLGLRPEHTLAHLARSSSIDATTTKVFLTPYERNLYVLCGAPTPEEADDVTPDHVSAVLTMLANDFAFVVVDTPAGLDDRTLAAVECASDLLLVSSLDVSSIRSLRKVVDTLDKLGVTTPRHFVLNRADAKVGIDVNDAAAAVGLPVAGTIPSSREVPLAMNLGSPVVVTEPKSNVAKQFQQLAHLFSVVETAPKRRWRR
jgi:pilus assembly protein CpaE